VSPGQKALLLLKPLGQQALPLFLQFLQLLPLKTMHEKHQINNNSYIYIQNRGIINKHNKNKL
jgi:hypothetical protein